MVAGNSRSASPKIEACNLKAECYYEVLDLLIVPDITNKVLNKTASPNADIKFNLGHRSIHNQTIPRRLVHR